RTIPRPFGHDVGDLVDNVLALHHFAEDGVLVVEPGGRSNGDEELAAVGAWSGVRHRHKTGLVELTPALELVLELIPGSTRSCPERVAPLDHEVGDATMEDGSVVERRTLLLARTRMRPLPLAHGQADEILDCLRSVLGKQPADHRPFGGL